MSRQRANSSAAALTRIADVLEQAVAIAGDIALPVFRRQRPQPVRVRAGDLGVEHIGAVVEVYRADVDPAARAEWSNVGVLAAMRPSKDQPKHRLLGLELGGPTVFAITVHLDDVVVVLNRQ
jgi:hypothetical protein